MALIKCSECGKEVSDKAKKCPHCGASNKIQNGKKGNTNILHIIIGILLAVLLICGVIFAYQVLKGNNDTDVNTENSERQRKIMKNIVQFSHIQALTVKKDLIK